MALALQVVGFASLFGLLAWVGVVVYDWLSVRVSRQDVLQTVLVILKMVRQISGHDLYERLQRRGFALDRAQFQAMMASLEAEGYVEMRLEDDHERPSLTNVWYRPIRSALGR